ncbi:transporter substrate-binding domain-containing protein [Dasania marina]|uniref:substrate-binding periplasmic protein n=1 Tax=Dasania marina TaxID=471499 RepID=UPI0030D8609C|tara:strand:+ start:42508 stop:43266 length:759 start_codon:yes stop_codon:yes gene_type:complete
MKLTMIKALYVLYGLLIAVVVHAGETVTLVADEWCPFTCAENQQQGIGVDLARKFFEARGYQVVYRTAVWAEAIRLVRSGEADVLIGTVKTETPDLLFPDYHFSYSQSCFFSPVKTDWHYSGVKSLQHKVVGTINGYSYGTGIDAFIAAALKTGTAKAYADVSQLFSALHSGEVDVFINDRKVAEYYKASQDIVLNYRVSGCQPLRKIFFAVSVANPQKGKKLIKLLNTSLLRGLSTSVVKNVHKQYGFHRI